MLLDECTVHSITCNFNNHTIPITLSYLMAMELKTARLTVLVDPAKKKAFEQLCAKQDVTPSQVVRRLIREYMVQHGATFTPSGQIETPIPLD